MSQPICLSYEALNEKSEDLAKDLAEQIKEQKTELQQEADRNKVLQDSYSGKLAKLEELVALVSAKADSVSKATLLKQMKDSSTEVHKESQGILKSYKKEEIGMNEFITDYKKSRVNYHGKMTTMAAVNAMVN